MDNNTNRKFSWRAFASVLTGVSFLGMAFTGVILFVVPPGRIANWTGWTILGLTKHQWIGLHDWFSIIFIVGAVVHTYLNWKALVSYFKSKLSKAFAMRTEWALAVVVCAVVCVGMLYEVRPFSSLLVWNESIKRSYDSPTREVPIHAELLTLAELAEQVDAADLDTMLSNLKAHGIVVGSAQAVVGELAEAHNMTPVQLYSIAVGQTGLGRGAGGPGRGGYGPGGGGGSGETVEAHGGGGPGGFGGGFGRMTLSQYCAQGEMDVAEAVKKLKEAGFEAGADMTMRTIADNAGVHPSEIRMVLEPSVH